MKLSDVRNKLVGAIYHCKYLAYCGDVQHEYVDAKDVVGFLNDDRYIGYPEFKLESLIGTIASSGLVKYEDHKSDRASREKDSANMSNENVKGRTFRVKPIANSEYHKLMVMFALWRLFWIMILVSVVLGCFGGLFVLFGCLV